MIARHGTEALKRVIEACQRSGVPAKVMCPIGGVADRALMSQVLYLLRPGEVLTHCDSGAPNIAGTITVGVAFGSRAPASRRAASERVIDAVARR